MPKRTCAVDGCERKHLARGLCGTHYNQQYQPNRHKKITVECGYCGQPCEKYESKRFAARFCSLICRDLWRIENDPRRRVCPLPKDHPVMWCGAWEPLVYGTCAECGAPTCSLERSPRRYCSRACRMRVIYRKADRRRKARHAAGQHGESPTAGTACGPRKPIPAAKRKRIFKRDDWTCWLCGERTSDKYIPGDPASPTLDHLTPWSLGGTDDEDNLATAHGLCNATRSNTDCTTLPPLSARLADAATSATPA